MCVQSPAQYREVHHSQADTFDKAVPEEINQGSGSAGELGLEHLGVRAGHAPSSTHCARDVFGDAHALTRERKSRSKVKGQSAKRKSEWICA